MSPMHKVGKFKIFSDFMKPSFKNVRDKTGAAENEINFKYGHHLFFIIFFFLLELKNKKIYLHCLFIVKKITPIN